MRSFLLVALLTCAAVCAGAQSLPAAPSASGLSTGPQYSASDSDTSSQQFASLAVSLPLRSLADNWSINSESLYLVSPVLSPGGEERPRKILDRSFLLLIGAGTGLTVLDFEMTQSCLSRRVCREANPLVPTSRAGMYATNIPFNALLYYWSYRRRASGKRLWWVAPLAIIGSHAVGVASNVPFAGKTAP